MDPLDKVRILKYLSAAFVIAIFVVMIAATIKVIEIQSSFVTDYCGL